MRDANPGTILLKDYQAPAYLINRTELHFDLGEEETTVTSRLHLLRSSQEPAALELQGQELELLQVSIDNQVLPDSAYSVTENGLVIHELPEQCVLSCTTRILPQGQHFPRRPVQVPKYVLHSMRG